MDLTDYLPRLADKLEIGVAAKYGADQEHGQKACEGKTQIRSVIRNIRYDQVKKISSSDKHDIKNTEDRNDIYQIAVDSLGFSDTGFFRFILCFFQFSLVGSSAFRLG